MSRRWCFAGDLKVAGLRGNGSLGKKCDARLVPQVQNIWTWTAGIEVPR